MFFQPTFDDKIYTTLKEKFLTQLINTVQRSTRLYKNKYNQERNYSVTIHPEIEKNRICQESSIEKINQELEYIEKNNNSALKKLGALIEYASGLQKFSFNNLFINIFKGKLAKRWLPESIEIYNKLNECSENEFSTKHSTLKN